MNELKTATIDPSPSPSSPTERSGSATTAVGQAVREWARKRGISETTLRAMHAGAVSLSGKPAIRFNYRLDGETVNFKDRLLEEKSFVQKKGGQSCFFNFDRALEHDVVYIVEGEMDALSLFEVGFENVVSVPMGAPGQEAAEPDQAKRYRFVLDALDRGFGGKEYILACDADEKGQALHRDLVRLLGPARCHTITWPAGIKDANDFLMKDRAGLARYLTDAPKEWPVVGVYSFSDLPERDPIEVWKPGFPEWERRVMLGRGMLSVATGKPGHGKTTLWQQIWTQVAKEYRFPVAIMSAETTPKPHMQRYIRQFYLQKQVSSAKDSEISEADDWMDDYIKIIMHPNLKPNFGWLMDMIEVCVARYGCRAVCIDPWNKLESDRPDRKSETEWIGECLDELMDAARGLRCHIQVLAHPAKPDAKLENDPPGLYSISGSQHWNNKVDQGFSIMRPKIFDADTGQRRTDARFYNLKSRFEELGYPCVLDLDYSLRDGRFHAGV